MRTRKRAAAEGSPRLAGAERTVLAVLAAGALAIPTIITSGDDAFRLPKELAFRAEAILLLAAAVFWLTSRKRTWRIGRGAELVVAAAVVAVTSPGARRWIYALIALLLGGGVVASGTRTALGALVVALIVFALLHSRRAAIVVAAALAILALPLLSRSTAIGTGVRDV